MNTYEIILDKAIQKCFDRCNLDPDGESMDI